MQYDFTFSIVIFIFELRYNYLSHLAKLTLLTQHGELTNKERTAAGAAMFSYNMGSLLSSLQVCLQTHGVFEM